ncbi:LysR family transcriptional regulator [Psychromonas ossibalaenae]|uniref:LysR family transcriptional regulator n=1 Tax=Psychromonas ossibalaenae TaxID=444922 RepID=UPI00035C51F6|nr:LysR substrate-binding domain-containing protein [Psychromonas ossibalaenae]
MSFFQQYGLLMSQLDLNLLKVFRALIEVQNTRKAAELLHLSQPAVSRCLSRLRDYFDDELFIRTSHGLEPTSKALEIGARLPAAMDLLMEAVHGSDNFDPSFYHGKVTIAINGFIAHWLAPPLISSIVKQAPDIEIQITNWESTTPMLLTEGQIQLAVNYFPLDISKQLVQKKLGHEKFVVLCRKDHPIQAEGIKPEHFELYPLASLLIPNWNEFKNRTAEVLKKFNVTPKIQLRSSQLNIILNALTETDMLFPCSKLLAATLDTDKLKVLEVSSEFYDSIPSGDFALITANKSRRHPLNQWLQACLSDCVKEQLRKRDELEKKETH